MARKPKILAAKNMETPTELAAPVKVLGGGVLLDATNGL